MSTARIDERTGAVPPSTTLRELIDLAASQGLDQALYWHCQSVYGRRPLDIADADVRILVDDFLPVIVDLMLSRRRRRTLQ